MLPSKLENLSLCPTKLIHVCKNYHLHWTAGRKYILCNYLTNIFFPFWAWLLRLFFFVSAKAPASRDKKKSDIIFTKLYFHLYEHKKRVSDF